jgi:hypothetical protein
MRISDIAKIRISDHSFPTSFNSLGHIPLCILQVLSSPLLIKQVYVFSPMQLSDMHPEFVPFMCIKQSPSCISLVQTYFSLLHFENGSVIDTMLKRVAKNVTNEIEVIVQLQRSL